METGVRASGPERGVAGVWACAVHGRQTPGLRSCPGARLTPARGWP